MEENFDALDVIARTRGRVDIDASPTGDYLFILWGSLTALFFLLEFIFFRIFAQEWCLWLWLGIPLIGFPWMASFHKKEHDRTHTRTREAKVVLDYWIFIGCASCASGFIFGFAGVYEQFAFPLIGVLTGTGAFVTGEVLRFRPKVVGGLVGVAVGIGSFLLQGEELYIWQMLSISLVAVVSLVIPGILYLRRIRNGV